VPKVIFDLVAHDLPVVRGCAATQPTNRNDFSKLYKPHRTAAHGSGACFGTLHVHFSSTAFNA